MMLRYFKDWFHISDPARKYFGDEPPLRAELFSADQMKEHDKTLAGSHKLSTEPAANPLLTRLAENEDVLIRVYSLLTEAVTAGRRIAPAGEWLLDDFYLIEEQIHMAKRHLPKGYSRAASSLDERLIGRGNRRSDGGQSNQHPASSRPPGVKR